MHYSQDKDKLQSKWWRKLKFSLFLGRKYEHLGLYENYYNCHNFILFNHQRILKRWSLFSILCIHFYHWVCLSTSSTIRVSYKFKKILPHEGTNFVSGTSLILNFETNLAKNIFISVIANLCPIQTRWPDPKGLQVNSTILSAFSFKNRSGWNELGSGKNSSSKKWGKQLVLSVENS